MLTAIMIQRSVTCWQAIILALILLSSSLVAEDSAEKGSISEAVKLPGIEINADNRFVDVAAEVCLDDGLLELIACTKGTKEHESIIAIEAEPVHVHAALLLIGARHGNPAMRKPINEEQTRWMHVPPRGDPIEVLLVVKDADGKDVERPISDFIRRSQGDPYMSSHNPQDSQTAAEDAEAEKFPSKFVFAGSHLIENENGDRQYLASQSGHIITISTFGDEMICLPDFQSHANGELIWEIDPTHLPKLGTKITLRLRAVSSESNK